MDGLAVTGECVVGGGEAEAEEHAEEEQAEHDLLAELVALERDGGEGHEPKEDADEGDTAKDVSPDVSSFCMKTQDTTETLGVAP